MILSHKHQFIFIHVAKTAGSSAQVYLSRFLGPRDLQIGALRDAWHAGVRPNARAFYDMLTHKPFTIRTARALKNGGEQLVNQISSAQKDKYRKYLGPMPGHCGAVAVRQYDPKSWERYFKFCFVRNPFERMASYYLWRIRKFADPPSFSTVLSYIEAADYETPFVAEDWQSWSLYTIDGQVAVDFIGRQERFVADMGILCEKLNIPFDAMALGFAKKGRDYQYRDLYKPGDREIVARIFSAEIDRFAYTF